MVPDTGELLEIGGSVFGLAGGGGGRVEEGDGLAGEGYSADEVAFRAVWDWRAVGRPGFDGHAEAGALDFAAVHGEEGTGCAEEGDYVCTASDGTEVYAWWESFVDVVER